MVTTFFGNCLNNSGDIPSIPGYFFGLKLLSISTAIAWMLNVLTFFVKVSRSRESNVSWIGDRVIGIHLRGIVQPVQLFYCHYGTNFHAGHRAFESTCCLL